jgi:uncharacterized protein YjiS (DUF1127 family)
MSNFVARTVARWRADARRHRDARHLARLPDHLLHDMGLSPDNVASLARQLRGE